MTPAAAASNASEVDGPKVSVAIITYNHERYIERAVESVLDQETTFAYEVVIGEDCSTDRTREILRKMQARYPDRLRLLLYPQNNGLLGKKNMAEVLANCAGEYVVFLEGDDYWTSPLKLQKQVEYLDAHPSCSGCFHDFVVKTKSGEEARCSHGFPDWFFTLGMGDWAHKLLISEKGPLGYLRQEAFSTNRVHNSSFWPTQPLLARTRQEIQAFQTYQKHLGGRSGKELGLQINRRDFWLVDAAIENKDFGQARRDFRSAQRNWWGYRGASMVRVLRHFARSHLSGLVRTYRDIKTPSPTSQ
jgi:glycosyltransferase involved in cell wall biosynthesis